MKLRPGILLSHGEENADRIPREFFKELPYIILKEVSVRQVIEAEKAELTPGEWSFYTQTSFDLLICSAAGRQPAELAVEFDSAIHDHPDQDRKDRPRARQAHPAQAWLPAGQAGKGDADRVGAGGGSVGRMDSSRIGAGFARSTMPDC
jgi:hypothetical protein